MVKKGRKKSLGRQKIEIKKIQSEEARQVCFSKRRNGIFKKACEISILCGVEVAVVVFSPSKRPFSFGHPSVDAVTYRFLDGRPSKLAMESSASSPMVATISKDLNNKSMNLRVMVERERQRKAVLERELKRSEEAMSMLGSMDCQRRLLELKEEVGKCADKRVLLNKYGVVGGSYMGNVCNASGVAQQFTPLKNDMNDMMTNTQGIMEYLVKDEVTTDDNGYFHAYGNFEGEGGGLGFGNNPFSFGFQ